MVDFAKLSKIHKVTALRDRAATPGERAAAQAALDRITGKPTVKQRLDRIEKILSVKEQILKAGRTAASKARGVWYVGTVRSQRTTQTFIYTTDLKVKFDERSVWEVSSSAAAKGYETRNVWNLPDKLQTAIEEAVAEELGCPPWKIDIEISQMVRS